MSSIHVQYAMRALHEFKANNGLLPRPWNNEDAQIMLALANKIASEVVLLKFFRFFSLFLIAQEWIRRPSE